MVAANGTVNTAPQVEKYRASTSVCYTCGASTTAEDNPGAHPGAPGITGMVVIDRGPNIGQIGYGDDLFDYTATPNGCFA